MIYKRKDHPELYDKVIKDFNDYILNTVSKPNPVFSGMPPCPFAKAEWLKNKVDIVICDLVELVYEAEDGGDDIEEVLELMNEFNIEFNDKQTKSTLILVDYNGTQGEKYGVDEGVELSYSLEEFYTEIYPYKVKKDNLDILCSNPEEKTTWGNLPPYFSILVQNSELLAKAIKVLSKAGYYKNLKKGDIVEGIADDPVYKGIKFADGEGEGTDIKGTHIMEDNDLYDQLNKS